MPTTSGNFDKFQLLVAFVILVLIFVVAGVISLAYCYCGRENEYSEIRDTEDDIEFGQRSASVDSLQEGGPERFISKTTPTKSAQNTKPTAVVLSPADVLAQEVDYFVRHMDHFYPTGFYCSVLVLENHMNMMDKVTSKTLRDFVRSRPEFKMRSNLLSFKLTALTPFREANVQVHGKFQCIGVSCHHHWTSLCSFADHYQLCPACNARVYPYEQRALTKAEITQSKREPLDKNFTNNSEIEQANRKDPMDVLSHIVSPIKPTLSGYQSTNDLNDMTY